MLDFRDQKMKKIFLIGALLILVFSLFGCVEDKRQVELNSHLEKPTIKSSETTKLVISLENTGNLEANVSLEIIPENPEFVIVSYPGSLEQRLQPEEKIKKIVNVTGYTNYTEIKQYIELKLFDKTSGNLLDKNKNVITIVKE